MQTRNVLITSLLFSLFFSLASSQAAQVTATGSGNWDSTTPDAPWPAGVGPGPTDDAVIASGFTVTVVNPATVNNLTINSSASCQNNSTMTVNGNLSGSGSFVQGTGATLNVGQTTSGLASLNATASGNTVNYTGNAGGGVLITTYYNLQFSGTGTLYNNNPLTVTGDLTLSGTASVQEGNDISITGNLNVGSGSTYNPSCFNVTVSGATTVNGHLSDGCGVNSSLSDQFNSLTIQSGATWALTDVTEWSITGSLTNQGSITGSSGDGVTFGGTGQIVGTPFTLARMTINGSDELMTSVTVLGNSPVLNGTLIMDINNAASQNQLIVTGAPLAMNGTLTVNNVGGPLVSGNSFQLFSAPSYTGSFSLNLPTLDNGLSWDTSTLATNGTITVSGGSSNPGTPKLNFSFSTGTLTLSWDTTTFPGFVLESEDTLNDSWSDLSGVDGSPYLFNIDPGQPTVFFRLHQP